MLSVFYPQLTLLISLIWCLLRAVIAIKNKHLSWRRELQLLLVYICIIVVVRFTFFPFSKVNGQIQPLLFDPETAFPFRINGTPFVHLFDYPEQKDALINLIGNIAMFLPLGIVWPTVFKELNSHKKVLLAGFGCTLLIEILQLPFYDRVSDIDDLILNSFGFALGYGIVLLTRRLKSIPGKEYKHEQH